VGHTVAQYSLHYEIFFPVVCVCVCVRVFYFGEEVTKADLRGEGNEWDWGAQCETHKESIKSENK